MTNIQLILAVTAGYFIAGVIIGYVVAMYLKLKRNNSSEFYTDYVKDNLVIRIFKPEFEFQAIGNIERGKILDQGVFSPTYFWAIIEL